MKIQVLNETQIERIKQLTEEAIENIGFKVEHSELLKIASKTGAIVDKDSQMVKIPASLLRELLAKVPRSYAVRTIDNSEYIIGGGNQYIAAIVTDPWIIDYATKEPRRPSLEDVRRNTILTQKNDLVATVGRMDFPVTEYDDATSSLRALETHLLSHAKHYNVYTGCIEDFMQWMEIAEILAQGGDVAKSKLMTVAVAIVSLKYYYNCVQSNNTVESILLIDELDATLHPSLQFKLLELFNRYSNTYKIQIVFTTHSLSLLEYALNKKYNVIYLIDNISSVIKMETPDIYKIKMYLHSITRDDIYINKVIPVFTEDEEARVFLNILLDYYAEKYASTFSKVRRFFHLVEANIGASNLQSIFDDIYLLKSTMQSICILDGDQKNKQDYSKYVIALPGGDSPEKLIMDYSVQLFDNDDGFWTDEVIINLNYGKVFYRDNIRPDIDSISEKLKELETSGKSTHGVKREMSKKVFKNHKRFFELLFKHWVNNEENDEQIGKFYKDLHVMFKKVAEFHGINPKEWEI
jgi:hypothetical protein